METIPFADKKSTALRSHQQISWIGIPTRNRSEHLQVCLESFAQCMSEYDRRVQFLVVDQTDDQTTLELNRQKVADISSKSGVEAWFAGPSQVRQFAGVLSQHANLPADLIAFACCGDSRFPIIGGANRNTLLLGTAGEMLLSVDDDTICQIQAGPEAKQGLLLSSEYSCTRFWFPSLTESADEFAPSHKLDICAVHEELLGRTVGECIEEYGPPEIGSKDCSDYLSSPRLAQRVVATTLGAMGDIETSTNIYLIESGDSQLERLITSESVYRRFFAGAQVKRAVRQRSISGRGLVSGSNFAIDNRTLLPPFPPVQQCQDSVFSALLSTCCNAYVGFMPWMVRHRRPVSKFRSSETTTRRTYLLAGDLIRLMINHLAGELTATTSAEKLMQLGKLFCEWSSAPAPKFQEMIRGLIVKNHCKHLVHLDGLLQANKEKPDFWASDLKLYRSWIRKGIPDPELDVTDDLMDAFGTTEARAIFQKTMSRFGQLLENWPEIHRAATELHARGIRVGTKV